MRKVTIAFKEIASRITGVSIPVFGVSWTPPASEREIVRKTLIFLEDRRALYNDFAHEVEHQVSESVLAIRTELTTALQNLPESSEAVSCLKAMRGACREYLDAVQPRGYGFAFAWLTELGRLRAIMGVQVAYLAVKFGIDIDGELVRIIPVELRDGTFLDI